MTNLEIINFENNLYYVVNSAEISDFGILNGYLYTDIDNTQEYLIIKLVSAISNHKKKSNNQNVNTLILSYKNLDCIISLNDWDNPKYFTVSFSFLFLFSTRCHIFILSSF